MKVNSFYLLLFVHFICTPYIKGQSGFLRFVLHQENQYGLNVDDILFHEGQLVLRGNIVIIDSLELSAMFVARLDTLGQLQDIMIQYDTTRHSHMITNTPTRFTIDENGDYLVPNYFYNLNELGFTVFDSTGRERFTQKYPNTESTVYPFEAFRINNSYYLIGNIDRSNHLNDDYILKTDLEGNLIWFKYLGVYGHNDRLGAVIKNNDYTFSVSSTRYSKDWDSLPWKIGSYQWPWLYTVDTTGTVVWEWRGDINDTRTKGGGPFFHLEDGGWIIFSQEYKRVHVLESIEYWYAPTVTRLDSHFNLVWKDTLCEFSLCCNQIRDLAYDPDRKDFVIVGNRYVPYPEGTQSEIWVFRMKDTGEVQWELTDTLTYGKSELHYTAGVDLAPSGSIYVAGYYYSSELLPRTYGWLMKVTPDGCVDTLCDLVSLTEKISTILPEPVLYPNPARGILYVRLDGMENKLVNFSLWDPQGILVSQGKTTSIDGSSEIPLPEEYEGLMFVRLSDTTGRTFTGKVIVIR